MANTNNQVILEGVKELLRLVVLSLPAIAIQVISGDPTLTLKYGTTVLFLLRALDKYIHENPNTNKQGLLPF